MPKSDIDFSATLVAAQSPEMIRGNPKLQENLAELISLQSRRLREEMERDDEAKLQRLKAFESGARAAEQKRLNEEAAQRRCSHRKENMKTRVRGFRGPNNEHILRCTACMKSFSIRPNDENYVGELMPDSDMIGGPEY